MINGMMQEVDATTRTKRNALDSTTLPPRMDPSEQEEEQGHTLEPVLDEALDRWYHLHWPIVVLVRMRSWSGRLHR